MTNEELAVEIQNGRRDLLGELWEQNKGWMHKVTYSKYTQKREQCDSAGIEQDDILQCCFLALHDAVNAYQPDGAYKLISYMNHPLKTHLNCLLGTRSTRVDALNHSTSLDVNINDDKGEGELGDFVPDPAAEEAFSEYENAQRQAQICTAVHSALDTLEPQQRDIVSLRHLKGMHLKDIAPRCGMTVEHVRQKEQRAFYNLRRCNELREYRREIEERRNARAYRFTGLGSYRDNQASSVELTAEWEERMLETQRIRKMIDSGQLRL